MSDFVPWLRKLAADGGKGVVNNVDARSLGRIACEMEKLRLRQHELKSLREMIVYGRSIAQTFPDTGGSTFAAGLRAHAQIIEDMLERIETEKGKTNVSD